MMTKVLVDLDFRGLLTENAASTQVGASLINKYLNYTSTNPESCVLVNNFVREASAHRYDNGLNKILEVLSDYISVNKTVWALASACEIIESNDSSYNMLNRNAAKQVRELLEMNEENVQKYIRAGALKNVMFCENFRSIVKQVLNDRPIVEYQTEYVRKTPVSYSEILDDGTCCFLVEGKSYILSAETGEVLETGKIPEGVSNTFKTLSKFLNNRLVDIDENKITISLGSGYEYKYEINEADKIQKLDSQNNLIETLSPSEFRHSSYQILRVTRPGKQNELSEVLESIALLAENYNNVVSLNNVAVYSTKNDKFVVVESEKSNKIFAELIASNHTVNPWSINESAMKALDFISSKTGLILNENYPNQVQSSIDEASEQESQSIREQLENDNIQSIKNRIEILTEHFKNDPAKLAVLSKLATDIQNI